MKLVVVTHVPDIAHDPNAIGNLAAPLGMLYVSDHPMSAVPAPPTLQLALRYEVFTKGELLLVGSNGREVGGRGRKPSKWDVQVQAFGLGDLASAVQLVQALAYPDDEHGIAADMHPGVQ